MKFWIVEAAAAAVLMAGTLPAQAASPRPLPNLQQQQAPPAGVPKSDKEWEAWVKAHVDAKGWIYVDHTATGAMLVPEAIDMRPVFDLPIRVEYAAPLGEDPLVLSTVELMEVDCMSARRRTLYVRGYPKAGMKGEPDDYTLMEDWAPLNDELLIDSYVSEICGKARAMRWDGGEEGPETMSQADTDAWLAKTVKPGRDVFAFFDEAGANYIVGGAFGRSGGGSIAFDVRLERYEPVQDLRSRSMKVELDCAGRRLRLGAVVDYPLHNLQGEARPSAAARDGWFAPADMLQALSLSRLCDMAKAKGL